MKFRDLALLTCVTCTVFLLLASSSFSADYYVKNDGNDNASGLSDAEAWETISKVNDFAESTGFSDGDVIQFKRGDIWDDDETLGNDGNFINWGTINGLTIQAYGIGDKPWFNANNFRAIHISAPGISNLTIKDIDASGMDWVAEGAASTGFNIYIAYVNGLTIDGIFIDGHKGASDYRMASGIKVGRPYGDLTIKNCKIYNMVGPIGLRSWLPIKKDTNCLLIWYNDKGTPKTSGLVSIHDNLFHDVEADCMHIGGVYTTINIYNNDLFNFGENGIDMKICNGVNIYNNNIHRGTYGMGGSGGGRANIVLHNPSDTPWQNYKVMNAAIRENYIYDTDYLGIRVSGADRIYIYSNYFEDCKSGIRLYYLDDSEVYNNLMVMNSEADCDTLQCSAIHFMKSPHRNVKVYNNSIYGTGSKFRHGIVFERHDNSKEIEFNNNAVEMTQSIANCWPLYVDIVTGSLPKLDQNAVYNAEHSNRAKWNGITYDATEESDWNIAVDPKGLLNNPLFKNPETGDFILTEELKGIPLGVIGLPLSVGPVASPKTIESPTGCNIKKAIKN